MSRFHFITHTKKLAMQRQPITAEKVNRIKFVISELDRLGKPTTMSNIEIQSLFSIGGTISKQDLYNYIGR